MRSADEVLDRFDGHPGGHLARRVSAHAVGDDEQPQVLGADEAVFVHATNGAGCCAGRQLPAAGLRPPARRRQGGARLDKDFYRFVLVDEAHAFRNPDTDQYRALSRLMGGSRKKLALMTATPVNNSIRDLYHQLMLFARHTAHFASLGIPDLNAYFRAAEKAAAHGDSASAMFKLIDATSVRRTRRFIQKHYPNAKIDGKPIAFPEARLRTKLYELDDAYPGLFALVAVEIDERLSLARYRPDDYRLDGDVDRRAQTIAGLLRTGLLKRFESSVHAFRLTTQKMIGDHEAFLAALDEGRVLVAGAKRSRGSEADDPAELVRELGDEWRPASEYKQAELRTAIESDLELLRGFYRQVERVTIDDDPKLEALAQLLNGELGPEKAIVFTYYADTADWIAQALAAEPARFGERRFVVVTGTQNESAAARLRRIHQFCPETTIEEAGARRPVAPEDEKDLLIATDVLAEGQNLQQARYIVNYDMPWNPMRLVQRNGRIDRLGSPFAGQEIYLYNLFPAGELEEILNLYDRLLTKIGHANISVGMEAPVFEDAAAVERNFADTSEQIEGIAGEDAGILEAAEARLDAFSGEEFRMDLRAALAADRLAELYAMPHGAGSGFRNETLPDGTSGCSSACACSSGREASLRPTTSGRGATSISRPRRACACRRARDPAADPLRPCERRHPRPEQPELGDRPARARGHRPRRAQRAREQSPRGYVSVVGPRGPPVLRQLGVQAPASRRRPDSGCRGAWCML